MIIWRQLWSILWLTEPSGLSLLLLGAMSTDMMQFDIYSSFEKGCRKKYTRQSRKVLWVVLSSMFVKEIWKNGTRGHGRMFANAKGKPQKKI